MINVDPDHWGTGVAAELFAAGVGALQYFEIEHAVLWARHEMVLGVEVPEVRYAAAIRAEEFGSNAIVR